VDGRLVDVSRDSGRVSLLRGGRGHDLEGTKRTAYGIVADLSEWRPQLVVPAGDVPGPIRQVARSNTTPCQPTSRSSNTTSNPARPAVSTMAWGE
jgi:hypothetical protein